MHTHMKCSLHSDTTPLEGCHLVIAFTTEGDDWCPECLNWESVSAHSRNCLECSHRLKDFLANLDKGIAWFFEGTREEDYHITPERIAELEREDQQLLRDYHHGRLNEEQDEAVRQRLIASPEFAWINLGIINELERTLAL